MFRIECEWDIGFENYVFKSEEDCYEALNVNPYVLAELNDEEDVQDLIDQEFIFLIPLKVWEK